MDENSQNSGQCPVCKQPVAADLKFCENCGAKMEPQPVCLQCGAPLTPGVKFCETCGKAITAPSPAPAVAETPPPAPQPVLSPEPEPPIAPVLPEEPAVPVPSPTKTPAASGAKDAGTAAGGKSEPPIRKPAAVQPVTSDDGGRKKLLLIGGVVALIVIAALAWFVILPMLSGTGGSPTTTQGTATTTSTAATMPASTSSSATAGSFEPLPTQTIPVNLVVAFQADRDPIKGLVTVTFTGGPGLNGISETAIKLTRADGEVVTKSFKPTKVGDFATLQGSHEADRVEVIVNFYNGESYRIIDKVFEYKKRK